MPRVSSGSFNEGWRRRQYYIVPPNTVIQDTSGESPSFTRTVTRADIVKSPHPRPSPLVPLPYSCDVFERQHLIGFNRSVVGYFNGAPSMWLDQVGNLSLLIDQFSVPSASIDTDLQNKAANKFLAEVKNQRFNAALAISEVGLTASLVANTASTLYGAIRDVRKGRFADAARRFGLAPRRRNSRKRPNEKDAHDAFLELEYGWTPLLADVAGSMEHLADSLHDSPQKLWMRKAVQVTSNSRTKRTYSTNGTAYEVTEVQMNRCRIVGYIKPSNLALVQASALGITNPLNLAWELVPFSFVADWFIPVGNYLNNFDATLGWDFLFGSRSDVAEIKVVNPRWIGTHSSFVQGYIQRGGGRSYKFIRTPISTFPQNTFPRVKNPFSVKHAADAIALLRSLFS